MTTSVPSPILPKEPNLNRTSVWISYLLGEPQALLLPAIRSYRNGTLATGAPFGICIRLLRNGSLVVWVPGYAGPHESLAIRDTEIEGRTVSEIVNGLGYAIAVLVLKTAYQHLLASNALLPDDPARAELVAIAARYGAQPQLLPLER